MPLLRPCLAQFRQQPDAQKPASALYPPLLKASLQLQVESVSMRTHTTRPACIAVFSLPCFSNWPPCYSVSVMRSHERTSVCSVCLGCLHQIASSPAFCPRSPFQHPSPILAATLPFSVVLAAPPQLREPSVKAEG